jgi:uncharacterized membrane protein YbhN (UPF0104 family)
MAAAVGVTPMILSGSALWSPLASAIAVGLIVSMFFTLIVVPVLFVLVSGRRVRQSARGTLAAGAVAGVLAAALVLTPAASAETRRMTIAEDQFELGLSRRAAYEGANAAALPDREINAMKRHPRIKVNDSSGI